MAYLMIPWLKRRMLTEPLVANGLGVVSAHGPEHGVKYIKGRTSHSNSTRCGCEGELGFPVEWGGRGTENSRSL